MVFNPDQFSPKRAIPALEALANTKFDSRDFDPSTASNDELMAMSDKVDHFHKTVVKPVADHAFRMMEESRFPHHPKHYEQYLKGHLTAPEYAERLIMSAFNS